MPCYLSKSRYCNGVQCPKMLWLKDHKPEEADQSVMNEAVLTTGNEVGDLAMGLFGEYTEIPFTKHLSEMITATQDEITKGTVNIAEASFSYDNCFCSVDIFRNLGNMEAELYEVKSSTSVHEIYHHDVSYQYWILTKLGYHVRKACLVHLNPKYVRHGELDLEQLFTVNDLTDIAKKKYEEVEANITSFKAYAEQDEEPVHEISESCSDPYECLFTKYCFKDLPVPNVFDLAGVQKRTKWKNYRNGIITYEDIYEKNAIPKKAMMQVDYMIHDKEDYVDQDAIRNILSTLSYPLYFLDFESFNPAVPPYDNTKVFDQIVFQYSLHYIEEEGGELKHKEFLAYPGEDPRRAVAEQLCRDIPLNVCTTAYNMTFEKTRIRELAALFPDLKDHLLNICDHIQDLLTPFDKKYYYTKNMKGSASIKYVLPALFPDDPSLDYHNLEGVHNGAEASDTFKRMASMSAEELEEFRGHLLKYCGLDTYAMVKVWQKLREKAGDPLHVTY